MRIDNFRIEKPLMGLSDEAASKTAKASFAVFFIQAPALPIVRRNPSNRTITRRQRGNLYMAKRDFVNRRLHSFLGLFPVGIFLIIHFTVNYFATRGAESFNHAADFMESLPFLPFLEIVFIYLPLLFHAVYGIYIAFQAKTNVNRYGYLRNWLFFLQRWTGLFLVVFIAWHVWQTRIQMLRGQALNYDMMAHILSNPFMLGFYLVGVVCAVFHFSNGLWSFLVHWGIIVSPRAQRVTTYFTAIVFILLAIVGIRAVLAFVSPEYAMM